MGHSHNHYFMFCLWLRLHYNDKVMQSNDRVRTETIWPTKPKIFTIWPFTETVCWLLLIINFTETSKIILSPFRPLKNWIRCPGFNVLKTVIKCSACNLTKIMVQWLFHLSSTVWMDAAGKSLIGMAIHNNKQNLTFCNKLISLSILLALLHSRLNEKDRKAGY